MIGGLKSASADRIVEARAQHVFDNAEELALRARLELHEMNLLAAADALMNLTGHRRQQVWAAAGLPASGTGNVLRRLLRQPSMG